MSMVSPSDMELSVLLRSGIISGEFENVDSGRSLGPLI
jgi:hypothetical protein